MPGGVTHLRYPLRLVAKSEHSFIFDESRPARRHAAAHKECTRPFRGGAAAGAGDLQGGGGGGGLGVAGKRPRPGRASGLAGGRKRRSSAGGAISSELAVPGCEGLALRSGSSVQVLFNGEACLKRA